MKHKFISEHWKQALFLLSGYCAGQIFMPSIWHFVVTCTQNWWRYDGTGHLVGGVIFVGLYCAYKEYVRWQAAQREAKIQAFYDAVKKRAA
ncbi:MAG: hypothetical protein ACRYFS_23875 [Janthinobacterium lividum]